MKKIPLTRGLFALVDDEDYEFLMQWKWCAEAHGSIFYASRKQRRSETERKRGRFNTVLMHREILGLVDANVYCDHINGDGLCNIRKNIRICTHIQNMFNQKKCTKKTSSSYKGVHFHIRDKKWVSRIRPNGKEICLGYFSSEEDAARAYDAAAKKHFGEFARLNFM